jgi:hypothetical protein
MSDVKYYHQNLTQNSKAVVAEPGHTRHPTGHDPELFLPTYQLTTLLRQVLNSSVSN